MSVIPSLMSRSHQPRHTGNENVRRQSDSLAEASFDLQQNLPGKSESVGEYADLEIHYKVIRDLWTPISEFAL